ncbi:uncharacterized protein [Misgurnus anguillicaudatus]|uniref:uncharacterized protein n=1 Tax=Misgurnus anguillicaudatus TaxID=75329 RepID=UPI003CCF7D39
METSLLRTEDDSPKVCLPLTNTEGSITKRGVDGLEVSVWSDSFSDLIIYQSRDSSHFADGKFMETSLLRTEDDSPKVCLPLTNTEGGKCRGAHGQDASVLSELFSDLKNIQGWDLLFSADQMSMEPFTTHAEPKACLSVILTDGDIFERSGVDGPEVDGCSDRFLDLTIHQSQDSPLPEYSLSPKVCLSLTDIEVDIGVNELEVDISSDSFPDPIDIDSRDLSLTPGNRPMDVSLSHTVDDSPEEQNGEGRKKAGIRGFFKGTCKAVKRLFLPSRSTEVEPIVPSLQPDKPRSDGGLSVPVVSGLEQSAGSHSLEDRPDACPVDEENAAEVCSVPDQTLNTDSDFHRKAHVLDTSDIMSASSVHNADEGVLQRNGAESLTEQMLAVLDSFLKSDIQSIKVKETSSDDIDMNTVVKRHLVSDTVSSNDTNGTFNGIKPNVCLSLTDTKVDIGVNGLEVDIFSDSFPDPIDICSWDLSLTPVNMPMDVSHTVDDSPEEQNGAGRKKAGFRGFCKAVKRLFIPSRSTEVEPIVPSLQPDKPQSDGGLSVPVVSGLEQSSGPHSLEDRPDACPVDEENAADVCSVPDQTATGIRGFFRRTWLATKQTFSCLSSNTIERSPSYQKLFKPTDGDVQSYYKLGDILGKGGFGMVRRATRISDGQEVAVKFMSKLEDTRTLSIPGHRKRLLTEVALLLKMSEAPLSPNAIRMYEWFDDPKDVIVIMEYPKPCKSLLDFVIEHSCPLSEDTARVLMRQAVQGVIDCIDHGVFHNDIHLGNMLVNTNTLELKLIDFGCGQLFSPAGYKTKKYRGVPSYCPPEVLSNPRYHAIPTNVWCLGLVLYKMVNGCIWMPYVQSEEVQFWNTSLSEACRSIIRQCVALDPAERPTLQQILRHSWFNPE